MLYSSPMTEVRTRARSLRQFEIFRFPATIDHGAGKRKISNWRPTLMYARTIHDPEYAPDTGQFKLKMVYIEPDMPS